MMRLIWKVKDLFHPGILSKKPSMIFIISRNKIILQIGKMMKLLLMRGKQICKILKGKNSFRSLMLKIWIKHQAKT